MDKKNLIIVGMGVMIVLLVIGAFIILPNIAEIFEDKSLGKPPDYLNHMSFDNSTPKATAESIARLTSLTFDDVIVDNVSLTPDGKYWIVNLHKIDNWTVIIDAKTLMSKEDDNEWKSLDELKATYIASIQSDGSLGKPQKITMDGKEIWKVPVYHEDVNEDGSTKNETSYVYVDLKTGKSKKTWNEFNETTGPNDWLTLKQVDDTINKINEEITGSQGVLFKDALRNLYPE